MFRLLAKCTRRDALGLLFDTSAQLSAVAVPKGKRLVARLAIARDIVVGIGSTRTCATAGRLGGLGIVLDSGAASGPASQS